eukprot:7240830-Prymnesium_polylepis.1
MAFWAIFCPFCAFSCNISPLRTAARPARADGAYRCWEPPFRLPDLPLRCAHAPSHRESCIVHDGANAASHRSAALQTRPQLSFALKD